MVGCACPPIQQDRQRDDSKTINGVTDVESTTEEWRQPWSDETKVRILKEQRTKMDMNRTRSS